MPVENICATKSIVAPQPKPVSKREILNAGKTQEKAEKAKAKPREERTLEDKVAIVANAINNRPDPQICHANGNCNKLNVIA